MSTYLNTPKGKVQVAKYTNKNVLTLKSLFPEGSKTADLLGKYTGSSGKGFRKEYNMNSKSKLVRTIFMDFMIEMLEEVIDDNIFKFPGSSGAAIYVESTPEDEVKKMRQMGKYTNINIFKSNFKIPRITFHLGNRCRALQRQIYIPPYLRKKLFRNAENGNLSYSKPYIV